MTKDAMLRRSLRPRQLSPDEIVFARSKRAEGAGWEAIAQMIARPVQAVRDAVAEVESAAFLHHVDYLVKMTSKDRAKALLEQCIDAMSDDTTKPVDGGRENGAAINSVR